MKKRSFILVVALLLLGLVALVACQGEQGVAGLDGKDGLNGKDGQPGAAGADGQDGIDGQDAENVELKVEHDTGIMWKLGEEGEWQTLITFDDLFAYSRTYEVEFDVNGGLLTADQIATGKELIYKEAYELPEPGHLVATFTGWTMVEKNGVALAEPIELDGEIPSVEFDCKVKANYIIQVMFDGVDDATGTPRVAIKDATGESLTDVQIVANIKEAFLADVVESLGIEKISVYDREDNGTIKKDEGGNQLKKEVNIVDLTGYAMFDAFCDLFVSGHGFYVYQGTETEATGATLTEFGQRWIWMLEYLRTRYVIHSEVEGNDGTKLWTYVPRGENTRTDWFLALLLDGALEAGTSPYGSEKDLYNGSGYTVKFMAAHWTNFFDSTAVNYGGGSIDKVIPFEIDDNKYRYAYNDLSREEKTYYVYSGLADAVAPKAEDEVLFGLDETYKLPVLEKFGYQYGGWYFDEEFTQWVNKQTLKPEDNGKIVYCRWFGPEETVVFGEDKEEVGAKHYKDADAIFADFAADFNAANATGSGHTISEAAHIECSHIDSSDMTDFLSAEGVIAKWGWLFDAIWEVNGEPDGMKATAMDFVATDARFFYITNLYGFFKGEQHKDSSGMADASADWSKDEFVAYVLSKGPAIEVADIAADFMADYNAKNNREMTAAELDSSTSESSWLVDMMQDEALKAKWAWLYKALYEAAGSPEGLDAATADVSGFSVKGFYLVNLNGFFTGTKHTDSAFGTSIDWTDNAKVAYVLAKCPVE